MTAAFAAVITGLGSLIAALVAVWTVRKGTKADRALDMAQNVQNTFNAQEKFQDSLVAENERYREYIERLARERNDLTSKLFDCRERVAKLEGQISVIRGEP